MKWASASPDIRLAGPQTTPSESFDSVRTQNPPQGCVTHANFYGGGRSSEEPLKEYGRFYFENELGIPN